MSEGIAKDPETVPEPSGQERREDVGVPGVFDGLARLPGNAILTEPAMARAFDVEPRTIRRMVNRGELPPGIPMAGKTTWIAGRVLAHFAARAERAEREQDKELARLSRIGA